MRKALSAIVPDVRHHRSLVACRNLAELEEWRAARSVFVYIAMPRELDTTSLIEDAWRRGQQVFVPRVELERPGEMHAVRIHSWSDCLPGFRGILEPVRGEVVDATAIDLVVAPGLAFDASGRRLGQGSGFYDRFLARSGLHARVCAIAFEEQVLENVPCELHDAPMDLVVTDVRVRRVRGDRGAPGQ
jgi:5-formyltetrahydrofolate cyclo-ligase